MDIITVFFDGLRVFFSFLLVLFLPGFTISLVFFPRLSDLSPIERLAYSTVLSIGSVMVMVLFMEFVIGINTTPRNVTLFICLLCELMLALWWCERWYLNSKLKTRLDPLLSGDYRAVRNYYTLIIDSARDRFKRKNNIIR
jgi:uncharacterized membrane protein